MMFCLLGMGGVSGSGFFCYVELFLSVPEGGQMKHNLKKCLLLKSCASMTSTSMETGDFTYAL